MELFINWNPNPIVFQLNIPDAIPFIGGNVLAPRWYGVLFALAIVVGYWIMGKVFKREKKDPEIMDNMLVYMVLGTIIGARVGHCLFYEPAYYLSHPISILKIWEGGLASHGAGIGILFSFYLFSRKYKMDFFWIMDRMAMLIALSGLFIRTGNLINSEICGKPTDLSFGFIFEALGEDFARHPSQLYEAAGYSVIFVILLLLYVYTNAGNLRGMLVGLGLVLVFGFRIAIEFTKEVQVDFEKGMILDMGQWLSVPFVLGGIALIYYSLTNRKKDEKAI